MWSRNCYTELVGILTPPRYTAGDTLPAFSWKTKLRVDLQKNTRSFFGKSKEFSYYQGRQSLGIHPSFSAVGFVTSSPGRGGGGSEVASEVADVCRGTLTVYSYG